MQHQKAQKIDLTQSYPCPCRRRGQLTQIALTEAFGCNRCQQIFVVEEGGYVLEELSTSYRYKRTWRWNGHQWNGVSSSGDSYVSIALGVILVLLITGLLLALNSPANSGVVFWAVVLLLLALLPVLMVLLAYRR